MRLLYNTRCGACESFGAVVHKSMRESVKICPLYWVLLDRIHKVQYFC